MSLKTTYRGNPSGDTSVEVTLTWRLTDWRAALIQLQAGDTNHYEAAKLMDALTHAVAGMNKTFNVDVPYERNY